MRVRSFLILIICLTSTSIFSQSDISNRAVAYITSEKSQWNLTDDDIDNLKVTDQHSSRKTGTTFIYFQQYINGIPIAGAHLNLSISKEGRVYAPNHSLIPDAASLVESSIDTDLTPVLQASMRALDIKSTIDTRNVKTRGEYMVLDAPWRNDEIHISKQYQLSKEGKLRLSYAVEIPDESYLFYRIVVDAETLSVTDTEKTTLECGHSSHMYASRDECGEVVKPEQSILTMGDASYRVYPLPAVSPDELIQTFIVPDPDGEASPFGWHDTDGQEGAEFTITRGNNVHAYEDSNASDGSSFNEPDGGENLEFNFIHDVDQNPGVSVDAATVNLFYVCNVTHDITYRLGFNEEAGNFQVNNYGRGGQGGDAVQAEAQDGSARNNANFRTQPEGREPRLQMFLFDKNISLVKIEAPADLVDYEFETGQSVFGPSVSQVDIEAEVKVAQDSRSDMPFEICDDVTNDIRGKVAMIDRGTCDFSKKVFNAQENGAVMAIICNIVGATGGTGEELLNPSSGENGGQVNIPSVFMRKSDCDVIKTTLSSGVPVVISARDRPVTGPTLLDSDFDNGVIIHEYAHGISSRLTGGASRTNCLRNFDDDGDRNPDRGEQMGEGWSDFFALAYTAKVGDTGEQRRGIATYLFQQDSEDRGFRNFPYSTDMNANPLTYDDIKSINVPHGVGEVWCATLWDMFWAFIEIYGFDPSWTDENSGHFRAVQLVIDGL